MDERSNHETAVELLQQLGLKEYEAKCFVGLTRLPEATATEISEISDVPRTRVYDAVRVLESKGLVEIQHSNPQRFRVVSIEEATSTLEEQFAARTGSLSDALHGLRPVSLDGDREVTHEVWALSGHSGIASRTRSLMAEATTEIILVMGEESVFSTQVATDLADAMDRGVSVIVGTITESLRDRVQSALPRAEVFVSGLDWLTSSPLPDDETAISQILMTDRESILVSTFAADASDGLEDEQAVFGRGFDNGLVAIVRRLMATGVVSPDVRADDAA